MNNKIFLSKNKARNLLFVISLILSTFSIISIPLSEFVDFSGKKYEKYSKDNFKDKSWSDIIREIHKQKGKNETEIREEILSTYIKQLIYISSLIMMILKKQPYLYISYGIVSFLTIEITEFLKLNINEERPDKMNKKSFPSGHGAVTAISSFYAYKIMPVNVASFINLGFIYICMSRIFARRHYMHDVLVVALITLIIMILVEAIRKKIENK